MFLYVWSFSCFYLIFYSCTLIIFSHLPSLCNFVPSCLNCTLLIECLWDINAIIIVIRRNGLSRGVERMKSIFSASLPSTFYFPSYFYRPSLFAFPEKEFKIGMEIIYVSLLLSAVEFCCTANFESIHLLIRFNVNVQVFSILF